MAADKETWNEYTKLVIKELERLNDNQEQMITKFNEMNLKLTEIKNHEKSVVSNGAWIDKVNDVWSPSQMKEAKDEIYKQKSRWVAAIAIIGFIQVVVGFAITIWIKTH